MADFIKRISVISLAILSAGLIVIFLTDSSKFALTFITGWAISFLNAVIGIMVISRAFKTAGKGFFNTVLLSMVVRMFAILAVVALLIVVLKLDKINLAVSMFLFYFLFLIMEINYLQKRQRENVSH